MQSMNAPKASANTWIESVARTAIFVVALFYVYGAVVHVMNMASMTGFDWPTAPLKWQVLDIAYLALDVTVALGFLMRWRIGYLAFFIAALSQIVLYTVFRSWIVDVPEAFRRTPEELGYLNGLVAFHLVTLAIVIATLRWTGPYRAGHASS